MQSPCITFEGAHPLATFSHLNIKLQMRFWADQLDFLFVQHKSVLYVLEALSFGAAKVRESGIVLFHNCTMPHVGFCIDLGSVAYMNTVTASGVLFHNRTIHHAWFRVNFGSGAQTVIAS